MGPVQHNDNDDGSDDDSYVENNDGLTSLPPAIEMVMEEHTDACSMDLFPSLALTLSQI